MPCGLNLIVATDKAEAGMMSEPLQIIPYFFTAVLRKMIRHLVNVAGKHQVLPYDQPVPVTEIIELIRRIISAAPHSDTVIVCPDHGAHKILLTLLCYPCVEAVLRNIVSAHGKYLHAIYHKRELPPPLITIPADRECTKSDGLLCPFCHPALFVITADLHPV